MFSLRPNRLVPARKPPLAPAQRPPVWDIIAADEKWHPLQKANTPPSPINPAPGSDLLRHLPCRCVKPVCGLNIGQCGLTLTPADYLPY